MFWFNLQLLHILVADLRAFSCAPAFVCCGNRKREHVRTIRNGSHRLRTQLSIKSYLTPCWIFKPLFAHLIIEVVMTEICCWCCCYCFIFIFIIVYVLLSVIWNCAVQINLHTSLTMTHYMLAIWPVFGQLFHKTVQCECNCLQVGICCLVYRGAWPTSRASSVFPKSFWPTPHTHSYTDWATQ